MFLRVYCVLFVSPHIQSSVHLAIDARNDGQWANGVAEKAGQDEPAVVDACGDMTTIDSEAPARTMMVTAERHRMPIEQLRCPPADLPVGGSCGKVAGQIVRLYLARSLSIDIHFLSPE